MASRTQQAPHSHRKNKQKQPSREKQRRLSLYEWEKKIEQHPNVSQRIAWLKQALEPHQKRLALPSPTNPNPRMHGRNASYEWTFRLLEKSCTQDPSPEVRCHAFSEMLRFCKDDRQVVRVLFSSMHQQSHTRSLRETYAHLSQELFVQSPLAKKMRCEALLQNHCLTGRPYSWRFSVYEFLPSPEEEQRAQEDYKALLSHYPAELVAQIIETGLENEKEHTFSLAARLLGAAFQEDLPGFDRSKVKRKIREATQVLNEPYPSRDADWRRQINHRVRYQKALRLLLWLPPAYTLPFVKTLHASLKRITTDANHARDRQEIQGLFAILLCLFRLPQQQDFLQVVIQRYLVYFPSNLMNVELLRLLQAVNKDTELYERWLLQRCLLQDRGETMFVAELTSLPVEKLCVLLEELSPLQQSKLYHQHFGNLRHSFSANSATILLALPTHQNVQGIIDLLETKEQRYNRSHFAEHLLHHPNPILQKLYSYHRWRDTWQEICHSRHLFKTEKSARYQELIHVLKSHIRQELTSWKNTLEDVLMSC